MVDFKKVGEAALSASESWYGLSKYPTIAEAHAAKAEAIGRAAVGAMIPANTGNCVNCPLDPMHCGLSRDAGTDEGVEPGPSCPAAAKEAGR